MINGLIIYRSHLTLLSLNVVENVAKVDFSFF